MKTWSTFLLILISSKAFASDIKEEKSAKQILSRKHLSSAELGDASPFAPVTFGEGIEFYEPNSRFRLNLRFRMQNQALFIKPEDDDNVDFNWQVRRLRLRMNGEVYSPNLRYLLQLSFARRDQDWDETETSNVVRDAMIMYSVNKHWQVAFGQGKLPGNRQRVVSSGDQQFMDRSILNSAFNLDRDFGFQTQLVSELGGSVVRLKGALTSGEGRNQSVSFDNTLFYTGRVEFLPFGEFKQNGDYFESDLAYETDLKLNIGITSAYLDGAARANGAVGEIFTTTGQREDPVVRRTQVVHIADAVLKYQGYSLSAEYAMRTADNPIINSEQAVLTGYGFNIQFGKMITSQFELALRYSSLVPDSEVATYHEEVNQWILGANYFLNGHRVKLQGNIGYTEGVDTFGCLQMELGI